MYTGCSRSTLRKSIGALIQSGQNRSYQSLASSITIPNGISKISRKEAKMHKRAANIKENSSFVEEATYIRERDMKKLAHLQNFLGNDQAYKLKDSIAVLAIRPYEDQKIELDNQSDPSRIKTSTMNLIRLGKNLLRLENTVHVLGLQSENAASSINGLNINLLEDPIYVLIQKKNLLTKFINSSGLIHATVCPRDLSADARRESAKKTLFVLIGLISFEHGQAVARKFIRDRIIHSGNGLMKLAMKKLH